MLLLVSFVLVARAPKKAFTVFNAAAMSWMYQLTCSLSDTLSHRLLRPSSARTQTISDSIVSKHTQDNWSSFLVVLWHLDDTPSAPGDVTDVTV